MPKEHINSDMLDEQKIEVNKYLTMTDVEEWFKQQPREKQERIIKLLEEES